jgi:hypothetical protein
VLVRKLARVFLELLAVTLGPATGIAVAVWLGTIMGFAVWHIVVVLLMMLIILMAGILNDQLENENILGSRRNRGDEHRGSGIEGD